MTHNERLEFLEKICGQAVIKHISTGLWRLWLGRFNENSFCPRSSIPGMATYFTTEAENEEACVFEAYIKLTDSMMAWCGVPEWDRL